MMKKVFLILAWTFIVGVFLMMLADLASADTLPDGASQVPKDTVVRVPGAGPDVVVEIPYIVKTVHEISPAAGNTRLRGGPSVGVTFPGRTKMSFTGGLIGEIGHLDSLWRLQGTFRAGNCDTGEKGLALNSGLAVMNSVVKNFRMGVGADLLYCSNIYDAPKEKASERIVGVALRLELVDGRFSVAASIGVGAATTQIPGGRDTQATLYGGLGVSYLLGK